MDNLEGIQDLILGMVKKDKIVKIRLIVDFLSIKDEIIYNAIEDLSEKGLIYQPNPESVAII